MRIAPSGRFSREAREPDQHHRSIWVASQPGLPRHTESPKPRAFGVLVGHLPSAILSLPAFASRIPPDNPVCTLVGSVGLCVRLGLCGASNP